MISSESSGCEVEPARLAAPASTPSLTAPVPSLTGPGGHIFPTPTPQPPSDLAPSTDAVAVTAYPDFDRYKHLLQYRGPRNSGNATILHPAEGDIGDGGAWYYVTVGKSVGVFNSW